HKGLGWQIWVANIPAYSAGIVNNYLWNRLWTFGHVERRNMLHQGGQFVVVSLIGLVVNTVILQLATHAQVPYLIAFLLAAGIVSAWNFAANHRVTFKPTAVHTAEVLRHPHLPGHHAEHAPFTVPGDGD